MRFMNVSLLICLVLCGAVFGVVSKLPVERRLESDILVDANASLVTIENGVLVFHNSGNASGADLNGISAGLIATNGSGGPVAGTAANVNSLISNLVHDGNVPVKSGNTFVDGPNVARVYTNNGESNSIVLHVDPNGSNGTVIGLGHFNGDGNIGPAVMADVCSLENDPCYKAGIGGYQPLLSASSDVNIGIVDVNKIVYLQPIDSVANLTITAGMTGNTFTNKSATGTITRTLPYAVITGKALKYIIVDCNNTATVDVNVIPMGTDRFTRVDGNDMALGRRLLMQSDVHSGIAIQCYEPNRWTIKGSWGEVTEEAP